MYLKRSNWYIFFALIAFSLFQGSASADTISLANSPKYYLRLRYSTELEAQQSFQIANANVSSVKIHLSRHGNPTTPVTVSIRNTRTGPDLVSATVNPTGLSTDYKNPTVLTVLFDPTFVGAGERWLVVKTTLSSNSANYYQLAIGEYRAPLFGKLYHRNTIVNYRAMMASIDFSNGAPPPPPPAQCGDGLDNDGDGKIDFGSSESNDPGCSSLTDNDETNSVPPPPPPPSSVQGFGSATVGGACATCATFVVTSLADSGIGTLRDALAGSNRNIVFAVAGTITLSTDISVRNRANITIDGSTAPGQGITIQGRGITLRDNSHDVIIRHMRIRNAGNDGIGVYYGAYNVVIDHCSISDAIDGNIDITEGSHDVTVQWTILGHTRPDWYAQQSRGMLINHDTTTAVTNLSIHHNFFKNNYQRGPEVSTAALIDIRNNVFWDWGARSTRFNSGAHGNVVNNFYFKPDPSNRDDAVVLQSGPVHVAGNLGPEGQNVNALSTAAAPLSVAPVTTDPAEGLDALIRASVGAFPRDAIDSAILQ